MFHFLSPVPRGGDFAGEQPLGSLAKELEDGSAAKSVAAALPEDPSLVPGTHFGWFATVPPAPGDLTFSLGLCEHTCVAHMHPNTHK